METKVLHDLVDLLTSTLAAGSAGEGSGFGFGLFRKGVPAAHTHTPA